MEFLGAVSSELSKLERFDPGDEMAFVLNDAVVLVSMNEDREIKMQVVVGYDRLDISTGLLAKPDAS